MSAAPAMPSSAGSAPDARCNTAGLANTNPFKAFYAQVRLRPAAALRQTLLQQLALHLQQLQQQHPLPEGGDAARHLQQLQLLQNQVVKEYLSDGPGSATVLFEAAQRRTDAEALETTKMLVDEFGVVDPQTRDRMQQTCLFYAAREGHAELCKYLLEKGLDPNLRDSVGQTCLFYAAREGRTSCLIALLQGGGDPNILDINHQTCLFYASRDNRVEATKALLQAGADPNIKDNLRKSAWSFAKQNNHQQICSLLKSCASHSPQQSAASSYNLSGVADGAASLQLIHPGSSCIAGVSGDAIRKHSSSSSLGSACAVPAEETFQHQPRKYRLQYNPLPTELPDIWIDCPTEKLDEFERLFPQLAVWTADGGRSLTPVTIDLSAAACVGRCEEVMQPWIAAAHALLSGLSKYEGSHIFEKPVDRKVAPGYYDVVQRPMSLSCVRTKLKKGLYVHPHAFLADVQLIFDNCALYNQPGSWVNTIGRNMQRFFLNQVVVMRFNDFVTTFNKIYGGLQQVSLENEQNKIQQQFNAGSASDALKVEPAVNDQEAHQVTPCGVSTPDLFPLVAESKAANEDSDAAAAAETSKLTHAAQTIEGVTASPKETAGETPADVCQPVQGAAPTERNDSACACRT